MDDDLVKIACGVAIVLGFAGAMLGVFALEALSLLLGLGVILTIHVRG